MHGCRISVPVALCAPQAETSSRQMVQVGGNARTALHALRVPFASASLIRLGTRSVRYAHATQARSTHATHAPCAHHEQATAMPSLWGHRNSAQQRSRSRCSHVVSAETR
eukprot:6173388-Pleurochrysis_carterae.AAC.1